MGYTTDFIGHVEITPALNHAEQQYLTAFSESRRCRANGDPYDVPTNPAAELARGSGDVDGYNSVADGQPSLWCDWQPCFDGCCLAHSGKEKFYSATLWMSYLIEHFLGSHALARDSDASWFEQFTFDHVLDGVIAACRRDTRDLYLIRVEQNVVFEECLWAPRVTWDELDRLPYEEMKDSFQERTRRRLPSTSSVRRRL